jgi:hypothetical protein
MKKFETMWQVIQEVAIIQEGGCCFEDDTLLNDLIQMKREEFPDCTIKVYHEFWITTHCSLAYERFIKSVAEEDGEVFPIKPKGDC